MPGVVARLAGIGLLVVLTSALVLYGSASEGRSVPAGTGAGIESPK